MIMMPIALKTLKESQTQEILFRHHQLLTLLFPLFSAWNRKSYFLLKQLLAPHFQKGEKWGRGGILEGPILFSDFFLVHSCMKVCMYTMHNFAFLEAIGPSIKSISHVFCLFLLVIICNTDQMICFHATLKSFFCQKQIFDNNRCVHYFEREKMSLCVYNPYNLSFAVVVQKVTKVKA